MPVFPPTAVRVLLSHRALPLVPAVVALVLLALALLATERTVGDELAQRARFRVEQAARIYADRLSRVLDLRASELELVARSAALQAPDQAPGGWRAELQRLKDGSASYVWIGVTDRDGQVVAGTDGLLEGHSIAQRPAYLGGRVGLWFGSLHEPLLLRPELERVGRPVPPSLADIALPLHASDGSFQGVLAAHLDGRYVDALRDEVLGESAGRRQLDLALASAGGALLLGRRPPVDDAAWQRFFDTASSRTEQLDDGRGAPQLLAQRPLQAVDTGLRTDWVVVASQPLDAALQPVTALQRSLLVWGGAAALLIGGAGAWWSRRLARPYADVLDAVAARVGLPSRVEPAAYLELLVEQMRRLPLPHDGSPQGEQLLTQVLYDASRLQAMLEHLPAPVYLLDAGSRVVLWNRQAERVFGWSSAEARGQRIAELLQGQGGAAVHPAGPIAGDGPWEFEAHMLRRDGRDIWGEWRLTRVLGAEGRFIGLLAQVRDRTAEREAELRLREQTDTLSAVIHSASDAVISVDERGRISLFNPAAERIFGRPAASLLGQPLSTLLPARFRAQHGADLQGFAHSKVTRRTMGAGRVKGLHADGHELELEASISQVTVGDHKVLTAILRDVTERVRAEQALARYQRELSELTQQLMAQEQETTRRLAQTLHDQLGQTLTAIRLSYDALSASMEGRAPPAAEARARSIGGLIDQAVREVRAALVELRPPLLEEQGLASALDNELRVRAAEAQPVALQLDVAAPVVGQRWPADVEYAAFMVAREALVNALRHADASEILVHLSGDANALLLEISDDGRGLPGDARAGRPGHLGMVGMRERAIAIGARFSAEAIGGGGSLIRLAWETAA